MKIEQLSLLATVVIAFAALAALVLTGQAGIRQDLRAFHATLSAGQIELRKDMEAGQAELRADLRAAEAELRAGQAGIRKDLKALEVRLAVVEQRTAGLSGGPGASAAELAPAASLDG